MKSITTDGHKKILLIGNYCQTITVIRSLARAGYGIIIGRDAKRVFTQYSRDTSEVWQHPDITTSEKAFIAALAVFLAGRTDIAMVFPIGETDITCLMRHKEATPSTIGLVMADPVAVGICCDKFRMYEMVSQLGIPQMEFRKVLGYSELALAAERMGYPCVVKPNNSLLAFLERKALIVKAPADLQSMMPAWPEGNEFLILQKFAPGDRHNCHFVADRGRLLAYFEQRVLRTDRWDGTGNGVDGMSCAPTAHLRKYCARLTERLNYSGAGCAQFLVDDHSGVVSFLEVNPRLDATCALPFYCGYDFPLMAVRYAEYRRGLLSEPPANASSYLEGKHVVSLWRDLYGWLRAVKTGSVTLKESLAWLKAMARTFLRGGFHLTWRWTDPLPTCYRFVRFGPAAFNHLTRKVSLSRR